MIQEDGVEDSGDEAFCNLSALSEETRNRLLSCMWSNQTNRIPMMTHRSVAWIHIFFIRIWKIITIYWLFQKVHRELSQWLQQQPVLIRILSISLFSIALHLGLLPAIDVEMRKGDLRKRKAKKKEDFVNTHWSYEEVLIIMSSPYKRGLFAFFEVLFHLATASSESHWGSRERVKKEKKMKFFSDWKTSSSAWWDSIKKRAHFWGGRRR